MTMLEWAPPSANKPEFFGKLDRSDPAGVNAAITQGWAKFLDGLENVPAERWSIVLAYLVAETGDVTLYPTTRAEPGTGMDDLSVTLTVTDWAFEYGDISDESYEGVDPDDPHASPSPKAEATFERKYNALVKKMAKFVKDAMAGPTLAPRFAAFKKRSGFAVYYVDQGETVNTANLVYLWGERPPKGFPAATPRELFTGLVQKAESSPRTDLKFDGDKVIEAEFSGAAYNDKYVDILESVPNVSELCKDLRTLILQATRIKPAAVERLKALFPTAEVKVTR
jgi:hypothetical protein